MARKKKATVGIVCAWRAGEDDLEATISSARESIGKDALIVKVEDKTGDGPGRTRHRGIMACDTDIIIIIDAHMRFKGDALKVMADHAEKKGLCCAITYHNEQCAFDKGGLYHGARFAYKVREGVNHSCLVGKWSDAKKDGPVSCVMGGAYAFRRDWYMASGQPLAMLPGWGGDEELLSFASWMAGQMPHCVDAHIAHRYRAFPPWAVTEDDRLKARNSRLAVIHAIVPTDARKRDLIDWQRNNCSFDAPYIPSDECKRFVQAMAKCKRTFSEWLKECCGVQDESEAVQIQNPPRLPNKVLKVEGVSCPSCGLTKLEFPVSHSNTYPNGNVSRRHVCPSCCHAFRTMYFAKDEQKKT